MPRDRDTTEEPAEDPPPPVEKAYCCGNSTQREATLIAKFDFIFSSVILAVLISLLIIFASNPDYFSEIAKNAPGNATTDLSVFLTWPRASQLSVLSLSVILHICYTALSIVLLIGAKKKIRKLLLIWFILTIIAYTLGIILTIVSVVFLHDKVGISIGLISLFLYKWYGLWIVKILMREISSISGCDIYGEEIEIGEENEHMDSNMALDKL